MDEATWLTCTDPQKMLRFLRGRASERKLRLFACACCRRLRSVLRAQTTRELLECSERVADNRRDYPKLLDLWERWQYQLDPVVMGAWRRALSWGTLTRAGPLAAQVLQAAQEAAAAGPRPEREPARQRLFLRDLF